MSSVITALFESPAAASAAIRALESRGIPASAISLVTSNSNSPDAFVIEGKTKVAEGAAVGAGLGGALGAVVAGLTTVGALATGGVGLLAAGPLVAALAGAGAGAAAGGTVGTVVGLALPKNEIAFYNDALEAGSVLVGVTCEDSPRERTAREVFEAAGAERIAKA